MADRLSRVALFALSACFLACVSSDAAPHNRLQVVIEASRVRVGEPFSVRLENHGHDKITYCVEPCGSIIADRDKLSTPEFDVQQRGGSRWHSLLWGCDVGGNGVLMTLEPGESEEFKIKIPEKGVYRLVLTYVPGKIEGQTNPTSCYGVLTSHGAKHFTSKPISVSELQ